MMNNMNSGTMGGPCKFIHAYMLHITYVCIYILLLVVVLLLCLIVTLKFHFLLGKSMWFPSVVVNIPFFVGLRSQVSLEVVDLVNHAHSCVLSVEIRCHGFHLPWET